MNMEDLRQPSFSLWKLIRGTWWICQRRAGGLLACVVLFGLPGLAIDLLRQPPPPALSLPQAVGRMLPTLLATWCAGYGSLAVAWIVDRTISGAPARVDRAIVAALAATPGYLPVAVAVSLICFVPMLLLFALQPLAHRMAFLPAVIVMVALVPILSLLAGLIALRLVFAFVIPVLRPVSWTGALSRSWTLVRRRWWRVFGTTMALAFPAFALGLLGSRLATTLPVQAISELMAMLLGVFAGSGMTLLFLRLDSLGPVAARRAHEPAHDSTVATA